MVPSPDNNSGIGEGYVEYTVQPTPGLATGTTIRQQAAVVFDINAALDTAAVVNTVDAGTPTSSVTAFPASESSPTFNLSWAGSTGLAPVSPVTTFTSRKMAVLSNRCWPTPQ